MAHGDKPTSFDIAALAGVSQPTVSRALRGDRTVSEATRERIERIARELNYTVDRAASSLRGGRSNTLAVLFFQDALPDGSHINPFFLSMLGSLLMASAARGFDMLSSFQQLSSNWHTDFADSRRADGIILLGYGDWDGYRVQLEELVAQGTHFVRWGGDGGDGQGTVVGCDNVAAGRMVGEHLIAQGRRRIAYVGKTHLHPEFRDRFLGLREALNAAGLPVEPGLHAESPSTEARGYEATRLLLARGLPFDAIFAGSDVIALGALRALDEAGVSVPGDVAVVGFDDIPAASMTRPPLTTVAQDYQRAGDALVDALVRKIVGDDAGSVTLPARLVVRASG